MRASIASLCAALATAGTLAISGLATAAVAATGPSAATAEQAGYSFTGAQLRFGAQSVYLRNAAQYSASVAGLGQSVQFWGGGRVYVLGVSDTTTTSPYSPNVAVFSNSTHALICAASLANCPDSSGGFGSTSYPAGHTVRESIYYNQSNGALKFTVRDLTAATSASYTVNVGTGVSFREVRLGTEFGNDPWSAPSFHAPSADQKLAAFTSLALTNYRGKALAPFASYLTASPLVMTGPGNVIEASPVQTSAGFATFLRH